jgi:MFS family permease
MRAGYREAFRIRDFRLLWSGQAASAIGDQIFPIATVLMVTRSGGGATALGLVLSARWVALIICLPFGGVWADWVPPRRMMIAADVFRLALLTVGASIVPLDHVLVLAAMVFLMGLGEGVFRPAAGKLLPGIVPPVARIPANALTSAANRFAGIVGPGIAGAVGVLVGSRALYAVDAATFVASVATLWAMRNCPGPSARRLPITTELREGLREAGRHRWVPPMLALFSVKMLLSVAPSVILLPLISVHHFGTYAVYGWSNAALAAGAFVGAMLAARLNPRQPGTVSMLWLLLTAAIPLALLWAQAWPLLIAAYFAAGIGFEPVGVFWQVALQAAIPSERMARVSSIDWVASFASLPLGMVILGPVIGLVGQMPILVVALLVSIVPNLLVLLIPEVRVLSTGRPSGRESAAIGGRATAEAQPTEV